MLDRIKRLFRRETPALPAPAGNPPPAFAVSRSTDGTKLVIDMRNEHIELPPEYAVYVADIAIDVVLNNLDIVLTANDFFDLEPAPNNMEAYH